MESARGLAQSKAPALLRCGGAVARLHDVLALLTRGRFQGWKAGLVLAGLLLLLPGGVQAQTSSEQSSTSSSSDFWRVETGWQEDTVTCVLQSHDGYLWLGTYHGLVRFDGVRFRVLDSGNTPGLQNGVITSLYEDPEGGLWIGHETGQLTRLADGRFQAVNLGTNWPGGAVQGITTDAEGDLWLLNVAGLLFRVRDGRLLNPAGARSPTSTLALARATDGKPWIVVNGHVATLEKGNLVPFVFANAPSGDYYERVLPAKDGGLWVVSNGRLRKWRYGRWSEQPGLPPVPGAVTCLLETRSGALLAGTLRDGLYLFPPGSSPLHFDRRDGLSHDWVRALCEDHEGNLWVGTGGGFDSLRRRRVRMLNEPNGWRGCRVSSFQVLSDGTAWVGSEGAGLYRYAQGTWSAFTESSGLSNLFVWSVLETSAHRLLVGTWGGGLFAREGERFVLPLEFTNIISPVVSLFEDHQGDLWIGTTTGLHRYHQGTSVWFAGKDKLQLPDVRAITETPDGTLWFGMSGGGLGCWRNGALRQFRKADGLASDFVVCLYADADNTLWIGTSDHGLSRFKEGKFAVVTTTNGLPTPVIFQIADDRAGNLWLGSNRGILRASKAELNQCADGHAAAVRFLSYGKAEGLASDICSGGFQPGACLTPEGSLWFPTIKGLAVIDPADTTINAAKPPVTIEAMLVDNSPVPSAMLTAGLRASGLPLNPAEDLAKTGVARSSSRLARSVAAAVLRIPPGRHRYEFHFTACSFTDPDKVQFKYKLEGLERDWQSNGSKRAAPYSYLPPGDYTFRVIACNNDDLWNETGASLAFTVLPYFWQTWWFEAAALAGGAGAVGAAVLWVTRRRVRRKLQEIERQRALERERARIARDIHDDLGASLTRITMLSQSVRAEVEGLPQASADVDQIYGTARELTRAMDEIVWAVNPLHDTLDSLVTYLGRFAQHFLSGAGLRCRLDVPVNLPALGLTSEVRHHLYLALKEALHNVVKHAGATEVRISLELDHDGFVLVIADNGRGFPPGPVEPEGAAASNQNRFAPGNGLRNMRRRMQEIGGRCEWDTAPGEGTRVKLFIRHEVSASL